MEDYIMGSPCVRPSEIVVISHIESDGKVVIYNLPSVFIYNSTYILHNILLHKLKRLTIVCLNFVITICILIMHIHFCIM